MDSFVQYRTPYIVLCEALYSLYSTLWSSLLFIYSLWNTTLLKQEVDTQLSEIHWGIFCIGDKRYYIAYKICSYIGILLFNIHY